MLQTTYKLVHGKDVKYIYSTSIVHAVFSNQPMKFCTRIPLYTRTEKLVTTQQLPFFFSSPAAPGPLGLPSFDVLPNLEITEQHPSAGCPVPSFPPPLLALREILFEVVPVLSKNTVSKQEMSKTKGGGGRRGRLSQGVPQQSSFRDLCGQGGVQIGNTKVFFRQVKRTASERASRM